MLLWSASDDRVEATWEGDGEGSQGLVEGAQVQGWNQLRWCSTALSLGGYRRASWSGPSPIQTLCKRSCSHRMGDYLLPRIVTGQFDCWTQELEISSIATGHLPASASPARAVVPVGDTSTPGLGAPGGKSRSSGLGHNVAITA